MIGIVGGLGPHAHLRFERLLLQATEERSSGGVIRDQDYPPYLIASLPQTPDRTEHLLADGPSPLPWLERSLRMLAGAPEAEGADFAVIACNAAHAFLPQLEKLGILPLLDVVDECVGAVRDRFGDCTIGLLGTTGTLRSGVYQRAAERHGSSVLTLLDLPGGSAAQEEFVMDTIYGGARGSGIKGGAHLDSDRRATLAARLERAVTTLVDGGAKLVVTGCTELPLVLPPGRVAGVDVVDPLVIAAGVALEVAAGERLARRPAAPTGGGA